jgi:TMEM175 potassium channel family protein
VRTDRLEAFSDGVFAIAITLLVLEIKVPEGDDVWHELAGGWESYAAYVVSFLTIGIIWVNHHALYDRVVRVDRPQLFVNLLLLMWVALIPFPTGLVADHLSGDGAHAATAVYAAVLLAMAVAFSANWHRARRHGLVDESLSREQLRRLNVRESAGLGFYAAAVALAFVSPGVSLGVCFAIAAYYVLPERNEPRPTGGP